MGFVLFLYLRVPRLGAKFTPHAPYRSRGLLVQALWIGETSEVGYELSARCESSDPGY